MGAGIYIVLAYCAHSLVIRAISQVHMYRPGKMDDSDSTNNSGGEEWTEVVDPFQNFLNTLYSSLVGLSCLSVTPKTRNIAPFQMK